MKTIIRPVLKTARQNLILIRMAPEHAEPFFELIAKNKERMNGWREHLWTKYADALQLRGDIPDTGNTNRMWYGIWHSADIIGGLCLHTEERPHEDEESEEKTAVVTDDILGYWLGEEFEGKNYACPAIQAFVDELFASGWERIIVIVGNDKPASKVILPRIGFVEDASSPYAPKGSGNLCFVKHAPTKKAPE